MEFKIRVQREVHGDEIGQVAGGRTQWALLTWQIRPLLGARQGPRGIRMSKRAGSCSQEAYTLTTFWYNTVKYYDECS